jgi:uncharacterized protein (DUF362 family)/NAD-dependent dihydropyrimidine dehydrogenase PreA subunit
MDLRGKRVLIKPNVLRAAEPDDAGDNQPAELLHEYEQLQDNPPAELVVGDNAGRTGYGANEQAFDACGLLAASLGHYRNITTDVVAVPFARSPQGKIGVSRAVVEADVVISLPKFKTHGLTRLTGAVKNCYGYLVGGYKARMHVAAGDPMAFQDMMLDVYAIRPPDLTIMDGILAMQGNGPVSQDLRALNLVLAADNGIALDVVMARVAGVDPYDLPFLVHAAQRGLGDIDDVRIDGTLTPAPGFIVPALKVSGYAGNRTLEEQLFYSGFTVLPTPDPDACTRCGTCAEICPVQAISMDAGLPAPDGGICIRCYCCQEICPEKAIELRG